MCSSRKAIAPRMCMRITASASSASRALKAATRRRWHISDSSRWRSSCQKTLRNVRGMPVAARIASSRRGLPAASRMIRWNASLAAMWSSAVAQRVERLDVLLADARRGQRGGARFEQRAQLVEVEQVVAVEGCGPPRRGWARRRPGPAPRAAERLADRRAGRAEALRERLRPQPLARLQVPSRIASRADRAPAVPPSCIRNHGWTARASANRAALHAISVDTAGAGSSQLGLRRRRLNGLGLRRGRARRVPLERVAGDRANAKARPPGAG